MRETTLERGGGIRLHVVEWPAREAEVAEPPLFLLHGLSSNSYFWSRTAERLPWRRVVAIDQRAHGASSAPEDGYQPASLAADAAFVIEELGLQRPVVAGHSWGGSIALQLAADRPDLVGALVALDSPVRSMRERMSWEEAQRLLQPPLPLYPSVDEAIVERKVYLGDVWGEDLDRFVKHGLVRDGGGWRLPLTVPIRHQILREMFFQPYDELWGKVECPVLLAMAEGGPAGFVEMKRQTAEALAAQLPGVTVHWYQTNHDIPVEDPKGVADDLERTALRAAHRDLGRRIHALSGTWSAPAGYSEVPGEDWDAKDLLAHIASTHGTLALMCTAEPQPPDPAKPPFDPQRWNASMLRRRKELAPEQLMEEVDRANAELDTVLAELEVDGSVAYGRWEKRGKGDAMRYMVHHQKNHLADLERALAGAGQRARSPSAAP